MQERKEKKIRKWVTVSGCKFQVGAAGKNDIGGMPGCANDRKGMRDERGEMR